MCVHLYLVNTNWKYTRLFTPKSSFKLKTIQRVHLDTYCSFINILFCYLSENCKSCHCFIIFRCVCVYKASNMEKTFRGVCFTRKLIFISAGKWTGTVTFLNKRE